jgi:hypothetical protein
VGGRGTGSPTGNVSFIDTSNGNISLGLAALGASTSTLSLKTYSPPPVGYGPGAIASGDFNGDGKLDMAVANAGYPGCYSQGGQSQCPNSLTILLGNGDGTFTASTVSGVAVPGGMTTGDFNGDGKLDLAETNTVDSTVTILFGDGHGSFTKQTPTPTTGGNPTLLVSGDFDRNGKADLAIIGYSNVVTILLGNGDGTFTAAFAPSVDSTSTQSLAVGDFNGDGKLDLAVACAPAYNTSDPATIDILLGAGNGTFTQGTTISSLGYGNGESFTSIAVGDFNGDSKLDLATLVLNSGPNQSQVMSILPLVGAGDGTFTAQAVIPTADSDYEATVGIGDFDGDGKGDISLANDTHFSVFSSKGDGTFKTPVSVSGAMTDPSYLTQTVGDFNGDGLADMAVADGDLNVVRLQVSSRTETASATLAGVSIPGTGTHNITAAYAGDNNFTASTSSATALTASPVTTALTVTPSASTAAYGTQILLTAQLTPYTTLGLTTNGETITFYSGSTSLGTGTLSSGVATLNVTSLAVGTDSITATYAGDSNFAAATASATQVVVSAGVAGLTLSPASLTFATQAQGTTSAAQTVTLTNTGTGALAISSITSSGDFAQTNNCGSSLAVAGTCTITVTFRPTTSGARSGAIAITDSAGGSPHTVALTGTGASVSIAPGSPTLTISTPGGTATLTLTFTSVNGFTGMVNLTCSISYLGTGTPNNPPTCSLSPTSVTVASTGSVTSTLTVTSTATSSSAKPMEMIRRSGITLAVLLFAGILPRRRWRGRLLMPLIGLILLGSAMGCGGGTVASSTKTTGTTTGSYQVVVTATSGSTVVSSTIPLNQQ